VKPAFILAILFGLSAAAALGATPPGDVLLRNLSADSVIRFDQPVVVRANNSSEIVTARGSGSGLTCRLRVKHAESYDRVIPKGYEARVSEVYHHGMSAPGMIASQVTLELHSRSLESIVCSMPKNSREPRVGDFVEAARGALALVAPAAPVEIS
jgi:hypothetical protein